MKLAVNKIGVLTSGGDCPGMNACIRAVVRSCIAYRIEPYLIYDGYLGLYQNKIKKATRYDVADIVSRGGTFIGSARFPEFNNLQPRQVALDNLKKHGIQALITLGGDGTFIGAKNLSEMGVNCIGIPCTIDNDIASTDITLGFDTAVNTIIYAGDHLRDTASSHHQCSILEVMGRTCGDLAIGASFGLGSEILSVPERKLTEAQIIAAVTKDFHENKSHVLVLVTENLYNIVDLAKIIECTTNIRARATILGHVQRGGSPTAFDRWLAAKFGVYAVDLLVKGKKSITVGYAGVTSLSYTGIEQALQMKRPSRLPTIKIADLIK